MKDTIKNLSYGFLESTILFLFLFPLYGFLALLDLFFVIGGALYVVSVWIGMATYAVACWVYVGEGDQRRGCISVLKLPLVPLLVWASCTLVVWGTYVSMLLFIGLVIAMGGLKWVLVPTIVFWVVITLLPFLSIFLAYKPIFKAQVRCSMAFALFSSLVGLLPLLYFFHSQGVEGGMLSLTSFFYFLGFFFYYVCRGYFSGVKS